MAEQAAVAEISNPEIPRNLDEFFKSQEDHFQEKSELRAAQAESMFFEGETPSEEDQGAARFLVDEQEEIDYLKSDQWKELMQKKLITFVPRHSDSDRKREILTLDAADDETYDLFNQAAKEVTTPFDAIPQSAAKSAAGYKVAAWELWTTKQPPAHALMEQTFAKMKEIHSTFSPSK